MRVAFLCPLFLSINMEVSPCELVESAQADFEGPLTGYAAQLLAVIGSVRETLCRILS